MVKIDCFSSCIQMTLEVAFDCLQLGLYGRINMWGLCYLFIYYWLSHMYSLMKGAK